MDLSKLWSSSYHDDISTEYEDDQHSSTILEALLQLFQEKLLADIVIQVEGRDFHCHRNILAAVSPYFKAMFTSSMSESQKATISLQDIDPLSFEKILLYAYTGRISINHMNAQNLLSSASLFQILPVQLACAKFMQTQLDVQNCIGIYYFASAHQCKDLKVRAKEYLDKHFRSVVDEEEFLNLDHDKLGEILQSNELNVEKEEEVFEAIVQWLKYDYDKRKKYLPGLLQEVRFGLLNSLYIQEQIIQNKLITSCLNCKDLLQDVKSFEISPDTYVGKTIFNMVLRTGMIKPEHCILLLGGVSHKNTKPVINCYNPLTRESYHITYVQNERLQPGFVVEDAGCVITSNNEIFFGGGNYVLKERFSTDSDESDDSFDEFDEEVVREDFFLYDNDHDCWVKKASMLFPKSNFSLAYLDGMIYSFGGLTVHQNTIEIIEKYDIAQNKWSYVGMMPTTLIDLATVVCNGEIYILGGRTGVGSHNIVMKYNPKKDDWTALSGMPTPRFKFGACTVHNEIFVVGGQIYTHRNHTITRESLSAVEIYNISTNQWRQGPELPEEMFNVGLFLMRGSLFACGTTDFRRNGISVYRFNIVYKLDLGKMVWTQIENDLCDLRDFVCVAGKMHTRKLSQVFRPDVDT